MKFSDICQNFSTFPDICFKLQIYAIIPQLAMAGRKWDSKCPGSKPGACIVKQFDEAYRL